MKVSQVRKNPLLTVDMSRRTTISRLEDMAKVGIQKAQADPLKDQPLAMGAGKTHSGNEDSGPIIYHVSTEAEEKAHIGGIPAFYTKGVISVIIPSCNEPFNYLEMTVSSVFEHTTPVHAIAEIIIVEDGTHSLTDAMFDKLRKPEDDTSDDRKAGTVILKSLPHRVGSANARNIGAAMARGQLLVFLDARVRATQNWLVPLVRHININYKRIAAPTRKPLDPGTLLSGVVKRTNSNTVAAKHTFADWALNLVHFEDQTDTVPILDTSIFMITKQFFLELGPFSNLTEHGMENVNTPFAHGFVEGKYMLRGTLS